MKPQESEKLRQLIMQFVEQPEFFRKFEHIISNRDKILFAKEEGNNRPALRVEIPGDQLKTIYPDAGYLIIGTALANDLTPYNLKLSIFRALMRIPRQFDGTLIDFDIKAFRDEADFFKTGLDLPKFQQFM